MKLSNSVQSWTTGLMVSFLELEFKFPFATFVIFRSFASLEYFFKILFLLVSNLHLPPPHRNVYFPSRLEIENFPLCYLQTMFVSLTYWFCELLPTFAQFWTAFQNCALLSLLFFQNIILTAWFCSILDKRTRRFPSWNIISTLQPALHPIPSSVCIFTASGCWKLFSPLLL